MINYVFYEQGAWPDSITVGKYRFGLGEVKKVKEQLKQWGTKGKRVMRLPDSHEARELIEWFGSSLTYQKPYLKKHYVVLAPLDGNERGVDWMVGIYRTKKKARDMAGVDGKIWHAYHTHPKEVELSQPPPLLDDIWGIDSSP